MTLTTSGRIASPFTTRDLEGFPEKRFVYAQAGIPADWMIDPDASTLTILELKDGAYIEVAVVSAQDSVDVVVPFTMKIEGPAIFGT